MSVEYIFSIAGVFTVAHIYIYIQYTPPISSTAPHPIPPHSLLVEGLAVGNLTGQVRGQKDQHCGHIHRLSTAVVVHAGAPDLKAVRQQDETHQKDHLTQSPLGRRGRWKWTHRFLWLFCKSTSHFKCLISLPNRIGSHTENYLQWTSMNWMQVTHWPPKAAVRAPLPSQTRSCAWQLEAFPRLSPVDLRKSIGRHGLYHDSIGVFAQ